MRTSFTALHRSVKRMRGKVGEKRPRRGHVFFVRPGEGLTDEQRSLVGPYDEAVIQEVEPGYLGLPDEEQYVHYEYEISRNTRR